jgi:Uma2 family endonuclease
MRETGEKVMVHVVNEIGEQVSIPDWVVDLESFRRWADADDFPEAGHIWFLKGEVWVDMSKEQVFTHVRVKTEFAGVLTPLTKSEKRGMFLTDGVMLSNDAAEISGNPDGTFVSYESLQLGRVAIVEGIEEGYVELEGSPDMVLEVISRSSVHKDRVILRQAYWEAGIREYWIVDARKEPLLFDILRHTTKGYSAARKQDGWIKSSVFGKSFRLTQELDPLGHPAYTLSVR